MLSGSDEVVRLVAGRIRSNLEKDEQIDRERNGERNQSRHQAPERDAVESRQDASNLSCLSLLLDARRHADRIPHRCRSPSTPRNSADSTVCIPQAINVAPGMTMRSVSG